ncbi:hypothetical protein CLU79DRAFT_359540 [Phycomyces nitens]|nr:hypothetical protein CLU79DRAFT_359540 [Phycomyces nitens]
MNTNEILNVQTYMYVHVQTHINMGIVVSHKDNAGEPSLTGPKQPSEIRDDETKSLQKKKATDIVRLPIDQTSSRQEPLPPSPSRYIGQSTTQRKQQLNRPKYRESLHTIPAFPISILHRKDRHRDPEEPEESLSSISYNSDTNFSRLDYRAYSGTHTESDKSIGDSLDDKSILGDLGDLPHGWQSPFQEEERPETPQLTPQPSLDGISLDVESHGVLEPFSQEGYEYDDIQGQNIQEEIDFPGFDNVITGHEGSQEQTNDKLPWDVDIFEIEEEPPQHDRILPNQRFIERKAEEHETARLEGIK